MYNNRVIVPTPGKPVRLSDAPITVRAVTIAAFPANATRVCLGNESVRAADGELNALPLVGGVRPDTHTPPYPQTDLSTIWVDAVTANEGVVVAGWID
jgi:hypothetical protein